MKRTKKKLDLNRRSLRKLDSKTLKQAAGGTDYNAHMIFPTLVCTDVTGN